MNIWSAIILATGLIVAALGHGGIYEMVPAGGEGTGAYRVNKFTGGVDRCHFSWCVPLWWREEIRVP